MNVLREELVEYSALQWIRENLSTYGLVLGGSEPNVDLREAFPTPEERANELALSTIAFGFNIDDGGRPVELGSDLTEYVHTIIAWTFATEPRLGRHIAHAIKHIFRTGQAEIPLVDFTQEEDPQIDVLQVLKAQVRHEVNQSPRPWDQFVWTTTMQLRDYFIP